MTDIVWCEEGREATFTAGTSREKSGVRKARTLPTEVVLSSDPVMNRGLHITSTAETTKNFGLKMKK